ncbi:MAG: Cyclin-L1, variant 2 [Marteilia pararefringens]
MLKTKIHRQEFRVLAALGYNVKVNNPHKIIFIYLKLLNLLDNMPLVQSAWNYMNDALRSHVVFPCHTPEIISTACICLAARNQHIPLPTEPCWLPLFNSDITDSQILQIIQDIIAVYSVDTSHASIEAAEQSILDTLTGLPHGKNLKETLMVSPSLTNSVQRDPKEEIPTNHLPDANSLSKQSDKIKNQKINNSKSSNDRPSNNQPNPIHTSDEASNRHHVNEYRYHRKREYNEDSRRASKISNFSKPHRKHREELNAKWNDKEIHSNYNSDDSSRGKKRSRDEELHATSDHGYKRSRHALKQHIIDWSKQKQIL